ncbi:MAG: DUF1778 domain-containing protein [Alphaproteobacteria bacterium]|nr:DUF1778 domain-containing protein [Alphaproteobacteria bacterium]
MPHTETKTESIELQIPHDIKAGIHVAAENSGKTLNEFLVEAVKLIVEETLMARRIFRLTDKQRKEFQQILDRPVVEKPHLAELLSTKTS